MSTMLEMESLLKSKDINPTAMRLLVLSYLKVQQQAMSLSDIEKGFEQSDRVTIYRTLKTFEQKGLIHPINIGNATQYALCSDDCNTQKHHDTHLHFICKQCNKTVCLTKYSIPSIEMPKGFQTDAIEVVIKGVCEDCLG